MLVDSVLLLAITALPPQQVPDSARALRQAQELVREHYDVSRFGPNPWMQQACRGVSLQDCMSGDWSCEGFVCDSVKVEVRPLLIERLETLAPRVGNSAWLFRQRVGFAIKNGELERAAAIAGSCDGGDWWCMTLRGLTEHLLFPGAGLAQFDSAFGLIAENPLRNPSGEFAWGRGSDARCEWSDIPAVVPLALQQEVLAFPCPGGQEMRERFWWLTDPLWTKEGNERFVEHLARQVLIRMDLDILSLFDAHEPDPVYEEWMWESVNVHREYAFAVRQGFPNSRTDRVIRRSPPREGRSIAPSGNEVRISAVIHLVEHATPYVNGGYSFSPDTSRFHHPQTSTAEDWAVEWGGRGCSAPWDLKDCGPERMIPRERWHNLQHQHVILRRGSKWWIITAAPVPEVVGPLDALEPGLALGRVDDLGLQQIPAVLDPSRVFRANAEVGPANYVGSIEVVGSDDVGRARFGAVPPPLKDGFGISDLALLDPLFESGSVSLEQALLPSTEVSVGSFLGLYFEVYGLGEGEELEFTLTSQRTNPSFLQRLARFLHLASPETTQELTWQNPGEEVTGVTRRFFNLDPANLGAGEYELRLRVRSEEGREAEASRRIRLR